MNMYLNLVVLHCTQYDVDCKSGRNTLKWTPGMFLFIPENRLLEFQQSALEFKVFLVVIQPESY